MIRDYPIIGLVVGNDRRLSVTGNIVCFKSASRDVSIIVTVKKQDEPAAHVALLPGEKFNVPSGYTHIQIATLETEAVNIELLLGMGDFGSDRQSGNVVASIEQTLDVNSVGGVIDEIGGFKTKTIDTDLITETVRTTSTSVRTIVSPVANVNGVYVERASLVYGSGAFQVKDSAPTGCWDDNDAVPICVSVADTGGNGNAGDNANGNIIIPAGLGLYYKGGSTNYSCTGYILYKVL